jgi:hypothetical protein
MGTVLHFRTINQTTEPRVQTNLIWQKSKLRQLLGLPWAADSCPWVGKLRTVLPLKNRVIRDSAVQLRLTHQRGANGVDSSTCSYQAVSQCTRRVFVTRPWFKRGPNGFPANNKSPSDKRTSNDLRSPLLSTTCAGR